MVRDRDLINSLTCKPCSGREKRASGSLSRTCGEGRSAPRRLKGEPWGDSEGALPSDSHVAARPELRRDQANGSDDRAARSKTPVKANPGHCRRDPYPQIIIRDYVKERNKKSCVRPNNTVHNLRRCPQSIHGFSTERYTSGMSAETETIFPNRADNGLHRGRYQPPPPPRQMHWQSASGGGVLRMNINSIPCRQALTTSFSFCDYSNLTPCRMCER